ncbi:MAG: hypothetical protein ABIP94_08275 [Planctomycetota bacterium]
MNRFVLLAVSLLLVVVAGCSRAEVVESSAKVPATSAPASTPAAEDDCTLATKLVDGIPGSPGHLIKSTRNPNGDSELSVLMRQFVDDLREVRALLEAKEPVKKLYPTHRKMRCAWPTKPEERNQKFDGLAQGYLAAVRAFDTSPQKASYNAVIQGCISCHSASCGGPLEFIDGMKWQ